MINLNPIQEERFYRTILEDDYNRASIYEKARQNISETLGILTEREGKVINLRFGFHPEKPHTLKEVGNILGVSSERVRQIEAKSLYKLRKEKRLAKLEECLVTTN